MSLLIKGMEMPTSCKNCELAKHFDGYNENDCPFNAFSFYDCPLIELPAHGDLIDRDELVKHGVYMPTEGGNLPLVYMSYVKGAKAVIPAERSEDGKSIFIKRENG